MILKIKGREVDGNDPDTLKKAIRFFVGFGFVFVIVGFIMLYAISETRFVCVRSQDICEFQTRRIWAHSYVTQKQVPLSSILYARLAKGRGGRRGPTYQAMIEMTDGRRTFGKTYSSNYNAHVNRVNKINHYLQSTEENLDIREGLWVLLFPALFILMGCFMALYIPHWLKKSLQELEKGKPVFPSQRKQ